MKALVLGCGYLGRRVATRWLDAGHEVAALTRSPARAEELRAAGIAPHLGDVTDPDALARLPAADVVLYAVGYDRSSGRDRRTVTVDGLRNALAALAGKCATLVFVSTTSVYGQSGGEWVDEASPTEPPTESGRLVVEAERLLTPRSSSGIPHPVVLRLSGLYGPGRLLRRVEQLRSGEPIAGDGEAWLNLIHVEDAATAVTLAAETVGNALRGVPPTEDAYSPTRNAAEGVPYSDSTAVPVYLVTDDRPVRRREYYGRLAELTGSPPPVFDPSAEGRSAGLGKRCRNDRATRELGFRLTFPTIERGLPDALASRG